MQYRLRDLVRRCLTKNVEQRPRDVGDLKRELQAIGMAPPQRLQTAMGVYRARAANLSMTVVQQKSPPACAGGLDVLA